MVKCFVIFLPAKYSNRTNISNITDECGDECKKSLDVPTKIVGIVSTHDTAQVRNGDTRLGSFSALRLCLACCEDAEKRPQKAEAKVTEGE